MKWFLWFWKPDPDVEYSVPILYPQGGKFRDHRVWAKDDRAARLAVMQCYDTSAFLIGPAERVT